MSILRKIPLVGALLKSALDAAGHKIENLGEPTNPHDAATKKYVDENGGGSVKLDDEVTETSENGVKSKGIWSWVKGLFSAIFTENEYGDLSFKKTTIGLGVDEDYTTGVELEGAGSYRSFSFPKTGGTLAITKDQPIVYTIRDGAIWNGTTQVLRFKSLYDVAVAGRAILLADVKDAADGGKVVMQAHQVSDHFVRFDATGKVWKGGDIFFEGNDKIVTRSVYAVRNGYWETPSANDGLRVVWNTSADELMKKEDIEDTFAKKTELTKVVELDEATKKLYVMKDGVRTTEEITSWATLFNLTKRGLVRLYYLASGSGDTGRKALYTAHMVDDKTGSTPAILFDATGFIGTNTVWTRTITLTKESTDGIKVEVGKLTEVAKKSDVPAVVAPSSYTAFRNGKAADEGYVEKALSEKVVAHTDDGKTIEITAIEQGWHLALRDDGEVLKQIIIPKGEDVGSILALVSQLSGITAQDIADFLKIKAYWRTRGDITRIELKKGDVIAFDFGVASNQYGYAKNDCVIENETDLWNYLIVESNEGVRKLLKLLGSDNEYLKAALFADTAFIDAVGKNAVIYLKYENGVIKNGDVTLTKFSDLVKIVKTGRAVLQATATSASGSSPVLFRPHMINDGTGAQAANILFDATGTIGEGVYTRCIRAAIKGGTSDELLVQGDNQRERLAKYDDVPYAVVTVGADGVLTDRTINQTSAATVSLPTAYTDLVISATVTGSLAVTVPEGVKKKGDSFPAESGEFLVTITKTGAAEIYVRTLKIEEVA